MQPMSQSSFRPRSIDRVDARTDGGPAAALAWPVSALILLSVSGAFWFGVVEAAIHVF